ncbi:PGA [Symbiodinium sp. CCMP2592]|nr:PGA [Symbiodinium sp. CCMP2592]
MGSMGLALTSDRSLRLTSSLLCGACLASVFRNLYWHHRGGSDGINNLLVPRSFNCRLMELTSILGFLASRAELQELYAGGYNARRRGYLSLAFLLQALCMTMFDCDSTTSFLLVILLLVGQLAALLCAYRDLDFGPAFLSPWIIRAAAGAGIAWVGVALCLQVQRLADRLEVRLLSPSAVVTTFTSAMGLAVCLRYDWMLAAALAFALFGMSQTALARGAATKMLQGSVVAAQRCRLSALLWLCAVRLIGSKDFIVVSLRTLADIDGSGWTAVLAFGLAAAGRLRTRGPGQSMSFRQQLHNHEDVQYFADFKIGGQDIAAIFDTGSFEIVVRSSRCKMCVHPTTPYSHELSKTYKENGTMTQHVYGSGPCVTMLGYDTVQVGPKLIAQQQPIWEILQHEIPILDTAKFAAIVGIGPKFGYNTAQKTLLMNYHVDEFSICLNKESGRNGYLTWGPDADAAMEPLDVATARVLGKHHWATNLTHVSFTKDGNSTKSHVCQDGCAAIVDSGTSLIAAPASALMELGRQIGKIEEDCSNLHELPNLKLNLDGHELELPPQAYVMRVVGASVEADSIWDLLFFKPKIRKIDSCMPAFMEMDMKTQLGSVWILGMPFFRYYHTTFNRERQVMRFAKAGEDCQPKSLRARDDGDKLFFAAAGASDAAYRPLDVNLKSVLPPRFALRYGPWVASGWYSKHRLPACEVGLSARALLFEGADQNSDLALSVDPNNTRALFRRGCAYSNAKGWLLARKDFEQVLRLEPNNEAARRELEKLEEALPPAAPDVVARRQEQLPVATVPHDADSAVRMAQKEAERFRREILAVADKKGAVPGWCKKFNKVQVMTAEWAKHQLKDPEILQDLLILRGPLFQAMNDQQREDFLCAYDFVQEVRQRHQDEIDQLFKS